MGEVSLHGWISGLEFKTVGPKTPGRFHDGRLFVGWPTSMCSTVQVTMNLDLLNRREIDGHSETLDMYETSSDLPLTLITT